MKNSVCSWLEKDSNFWKTVEEQKMKTHNDIAKDIDCLHQHQGHLNNIKENIEGAEGEIPAREDIASNLKIINLIEESLDKDVSLAKSYDYFGYSPSLDKMNGHVKVLCDQLVKKKKEIIAIAEIPTAASKTKASEFNFTGNNISNFNLWRDLLFKDFSCLRKEGGRS